MEFLPDLQQQNILCCQCGALTAANPSNMCQTCLRTTVDISDGIPKQATLHFCRHCSRYLQPPNHWVLCDLESRELLAICLKKLRQLTKVRLVDASFLWTEPHSRRIRVKITIQKEVFTSAIVQQTFEVEYTVVNQQCESCQRVQAQNTWKAMVQVRQKVPHKRTFLFLEQLILKHGAHKDTVNIKEAKDGLDFFFAQRSHAVRMCEFLQQVVPVKVKTSEQLISKDIHSNTSNYKFTYSVDILPICKDDLICLPKKLAQSLGNIAQLVLCSRIGTSIQILDPNTLQSADITTTVYQRSPFPALCTTPALIQYEVLDVELLGPTRGRYALADILVARSSDFGRNDVTFYARSHLGNILKPGDQVMGYDLARSNYNNEAWEDLDRRQVTDVILVKKVYGGGKARSKGRKWRLKRMARMTEEDAGGKSSRRRQEDTRDEDDYEAFLRDLEEDPELRANVNLYKVKPRKKDVDMEEDSGVAADDEMGADADLPDVPIEELLEDLTLGDSDEEDTEAGLGEDDEAME